MDDSRFFDDNIEKTMSIITTFTTLKDKKITAEAAIRAAMPYIGQDMQKRLGIVVKAMNISRLMKKYSNLSVQTDKLKKSKKEMLTELREEFDTHDRQLLDLFIKFTEIKELLDTVSPSV